MREAWLRRSVIGSLLVLAWLAPLHASACSMVTSGFSLPGEDDNGGKPIALPVGADVLISYLCSCTSVAESNVPPFTVQDDSGRLVPGSAHWLDVAGSPTDRTFYLRWHPETELAEGTYVLHLGDNEREFVVEGSAAETAGLDYDAMLRTQDVELGTQISCGNALGCSRLVRTQLRALPTVDVAVRSDLTPSQSTQFLYRLVAVNTPDGRKPGSWQMFGTTGALSLSFQESAAKYCFQLETMRVRDGKIALIGEACLADTLGELPGIRAFPIEQCDTALFYAALWCRDNADICDAMRDQPDEACAGYDTVCNDPRVAEGVDLLAAHADAGAVEPDAGAVEPDAGRAVRAAGAKAEDRDVAAPHASGSCSAVPGELHSQLFGAAVAIVAFVSRRRAQRRR